MATATVIIIIVIGAILGVCVIDKDKAWRLVSALLILLLTYGAINLQHEYDKQHCAPQHAQVTGQAFK